MSDLAIPNIECVESIDNFGRFQAEPLEKGFGVTLGNSLRRVLLGYLPGAAVTRVSIEGIQHEFSVIPYAKEPIKTGLVLVDSKKFSIPHKKEGEPPSIPSGVPTALSPIEPAKDSTLIIAAGVGIALLALTAGKKKK